MKLLVLDDNQLQLQETCMLIHTMMQKNNLTYSLHSQTHINNISNIIHHYDIVFSETIIDHKNCIDIFTIIRKQHSDFRLIFLTSYDDYHLMIDGYKANADRYFLKPISLSELETEMSFILRSYLDSKYIYDPSLTIPKLFLKEILYIETYNRQTTLYLNNGNHIDKKHPLKYWKSQLSNDAFIQTHKSFLINLQYVKRFHTSQIILTNQKKLPLSRHFKESFYHAYSLYCRFHDLRNHR